MTLRGTSAFVFALALSGACPALASTDWPDVAVPIRTNADASADYAVVIGNSRYANLGRPLPSADADAEAVARALRDTRGIPPARVDHFRNAGVFEMEESLRKAGERTGPEGTVWVFFAGHGAAHPNTGDRLLLADEARAAGTAEGFARYGLSLARARELAGAGGAQVLFLVDACYTGLGRDGEDVTGGTRFVGTTQALTAARTVQWTAASGNQWATELPGVGHGAFTYGVLGALRGWADGAVDGKRDGVVTLAEAELYVLQMLDEVGVRSQRPELVSPVDAHELVLVERGRARFEPRPQLPRIEVGRRAPTGSAAKVEGSFGYAPAEGIAAAELLRQQRCDEEAARKADSQANTRLEAEQARVAKEAAGVWSKRVSDWEACVELRDESARERCAQDLATFLDAATKARVTLADGVEDVTTECGARRWAVPARSADVVIAQLSDARSLLARVRAGPAASAPPGVAVPAGPWSGGPGRLKMVRVEPAPFVMGTRLDDPTHQANEGPVEVGFQRGFFVTSTEITQRLYRAVTGDNPAERNPTYDRVSLVGDDLPVHSVSWFEAVAFANTLSERDGLQPAYRIQGERVSWDRAADGWRLPTEAEWEFAARAGVRAELYAGGNAPLGVCRYGNVSDRTTAARFPGFDAFPCDDGVTAIAEVGSFASNALGLHDVTGNVWEWVWDAYVSSLVGGVDPARMEGATRVFKGGGWGDAPTTARAAQREHAPPGTRRDYIGFRLVRSLSD